MVRLTNLKVPLDYTEDSLKTILLKKLKLNPSDLISFSVTRRSIDARDKQDVHFVLSLDLSLKNETGALRRNKNLAPLSAQCNHNKNASFFRDKSRERTK